METSSFFYKLFYDRNVLRKDLLTAVNSLGLSFDSKFNVYVKTFYHNIINDIIFC